MTDPNTIEFRSTMASFATGVAVVTMPDGESVHGITVSSFASASLTPPLISFLIDRDAHAHDLLLNAERFAVSILRFDQQAVSDLFAGRPVPVWEPLTEEPGFPVVRDALAWMICTPHATADAGDHTLFLGRVQETRFDLTGEPLLYFRGAYSELALERTGKSR